MEMISPQILEGWILPDKVEQYVDALYLAKFIAAMLEVMQDGYGEVNMKLTIRGSKVKAVSVSKTQSFDLEHLGRKD